MNKTVTSNVKPHQKVTSPSIKTLKKLDQIFLVLQSNRENRETRNISGMLLCCKKKANQIWDNETARKKVD